MAYTATQSGMTPRSVSARSSSDSKAVSTYVLGDCHRESSTASPSWRAWRCFVAGARNGRRARPDISTENDTQPEHARQERWRYGTWGMPVHLFGVGLPWAGGYRKNRTLQTWLQHLWHHFSISFGQSCAIVLGWLARSWVSNHGGFSWKYWCGL